MTHLKIELNTGITEQVSSAVILKLYDVVTNNTLDNTSHLLGSLNADATYQTYIDVLTDRTNSLTEDLYITATKKYLMFEDSVFKDILINQLNIGDGVGITVSDVLSITVLKKVNDKNFLQTNTAITSLNDLLYFTNLTSLGEQFAKGCTNLQSVTIPGNIIDLSDGTGTTNGCFSGCSSLTSVTLLEGILRIGNRCFYQCTSLTSIDIPSTVTILGYNNSYVDSQRNYGVFSGCNLLTTITGGENITVLGNGIFLQCSNLTSIPDFQFLNITSIGTDCFFGCNNLLNIQELNLTSLNDKIYYGSFYSSSVRKIKSLGGITEILSQGNVQIRRPFGNCLNLTEVDLSTTTSLTTIGDAAFLGCNNLVTVKLPSSLTTIGAGAFSSNAINNRTYYIYATTPPTLTASTDISSIGSSPLPMPAAIYVPNGCGNTYKAASYWSDFSSVIQEMPAS